MTPERFHSFILAPGLAAVAAICDVRESQAASRWLLAVAMQESGLEYRYQQGTSLKYPGPARGWWQFERAGGVAGVLRHPASAARARTLCTWYEVEAGQYPVWRALEGHDGLAVGFARLLLITDPHAIPIQQDAAWDCYLRVWRPGKPHEAQWAGHWQRAGAAVRVSA